MSTLRDRAIAEEARRQSMLVCGRRSEADALDFIAEITDTRDWRSGGTTALPSVASHVAPVNDAEIVHRDPKVLRGTPVFSGTRVPVQALFDQLRAGDTVDRFLDQFRR